MEIDMEESCPRWRKLWLGADAAAAVCLKPQVMLILVVICVFSVVWWTSVLSIFVDNQLLPAAASELKFASRFQADQYAKDRHHKYILVWTECYGTVGCGWPMRTAMFEEKQCPEVRCFLTTNRHLLNQASIVIFHIRDLSNILHEDLPSYHDPSQIWVFFTMEPPYFTFTGMYIGRDINKYSGNLAYLDGKFNATMTYMRESDFPTPYCGFKERTTPLTPDENITAANKSRTILWVVSNCSPKSFRNWYVRELETYIDVDIYGYCGTPFPCDKNNQTCTNQFFSQYKFYLAFENSQCREYITEKLWNSLGLSVVPIVMGAWPEDYAALTPPHSIINIDNFSGPEQLAHYINYLNGNDSAYNEYLSWKKEYVLAYDKTGTNNPFCKMCQVAHNATLWPRKSYNVSSWYSSSRLCRE